MEGGTSNGPVPKGKKRISVWREMCLFVLLALVASAAARDSFCNETGWDIVWRDEFDEPTLNTSRWTVRGAGAPGCGSAECQPSNVQLAGGMLRLTALSASSAGAVDTRDKSVWDATTGSSFRVCMFVSFPSGAGGTGAGLWPAIRMLPNDNSCLPDHGVLTIAEQVNGQEALNASYTTTPAGNPPCSNAFVTGTGSIDELVPWYNEVSVEVSPDGSFFYIYNGDIVYGWDEKMPLHTNPWFLDLSFPIGGKAGPANATTAFPAVVNVDYVRVAVQTAK